MPLLNVQQRNIFESQFEVQCGAGTYGPLDKLAPRRRSCDSADARATGERGDPGGTMRFSVARKERSLLGPAGNLHPRSLGAPRRHREAGPAQPARALARVEPVAVGADPREASA